MRKFSLLATTAVTVAALSTTTVAQGRGTGKAPTTKSPSVGATAQGSGPSTHGSSGSKAGNTGQGVTTKTTGTSHGASNKPTKTTSTSTGTSTSSGATTTTVSTGTTSTPPPTFEPNAISTKISKNPSQLAKVKTMLPTGMTIEEASTGFRNQGQFIAALNASRNQGLDFVQLKDAMTVDGLSLGQAAKQVRTAPAPLPADAPATGSTTTVSVSTGSTTVSGSTTTTSGTTTVPAVK